MYISRSVSPESVHRFPFAERNSSYAFLRIRLSHCISVRWWHTKQTNTTWLKGGSSSGFHGDGIISLCSKTYYCFGDGKDTFSCKGVNKKNNVINKDKYLDVILSKRSGSGVNRGFRVMNNTMCTYVQVKNAFSYFYPKRKVLEDGVATIPLDI